MLGTEPRTCKHYTLNWAISCPFICLSCLERTQINTSCLFQSHSTVFSEMRSLAEPRAFANQARLASQKILPDSYTGFHTGPHPAFAVVACMCVHMEFREPLWEAGFLFSPLCMLCSNFFKDTTFCLRGKLGKCQLFYEEVKYSTLLMQTP